MPIKLNGETSGSIELDVPAAVGSDLQLTLPATAGTALVAPGSTSITVPSVDGTLDRLERAGNILQVVQTVKTDGYSRQSSSSDFAGITGLSVNITPTSSTSKIYLTGGITCSSGNGQRFFLRLTRDGSVVDAYRSPTQGIRVRAFAAGFGGSSDNSLRQLSVNFLDSPATTSQVTYQIEGSAEGSQVLYVNVSKANGNSDAVGRGVSTLTAIEVAA
jgi:hypothetical protein